MKLIWNVIIDKYRLLLSDNFTTFRKYQLPGKKLCYLWGYSHIKHTIPYISRRLPKTLQSRIHISTSNISIHNTGYSMTLYCYGTLINLNNQSFLVVECHVGKSLIGTWGPFKCSHVLIQSSVNFAPPYRNYNNAITPNTNYYVDNTEAHTTFKQDVHISYNLNNN